MRTAALLFFCVQLWTGGSQDQRDTAWFLKALVKGCTWNSCVVPLTTGDDPRSSSVQLHRQVPMLSDGEDDDQPDKASEAGASACYEQPRSSRD